MNSKNAWKDSGYPVIIIGTVRETEPGADSALPYFKHVINIEVSEVFRAVTCPFFTY
jgi:hypothetical protein